MSKTNDDYARSATQEEYDYWYTNYQLQGIDAENRAIVAAILAVGSLLRYDGLTR